MFSPKKELVAACFGLSALVFAATALAQRSQENPRARMRELLIEKRDALASKLSYVEAQFQQGGLESNVVLDVQMEVLHARLALAETDADRIKILEQQIDNRRANEARIEEQYNLGLLQLDVKIDANVQRIDAEIALQRERQND